LEPLSELRERLHVERLINLELEHRLQLLILEAQVLLALLKLDDKRLLPPIPLYSRQ